MNHRQKLIQKQFLNNEEAVIKRLEQVYGVALKDIDGKIEKLMKRFDPETGDLPQSAIYQIQYQKMLKGQIEGILNQMQTAQFLTVSDYLDSCYEDGFIGSLFDLHGQGIPLAIPMDQTKLIRAVQLDSKISKGLYNRLGEDVGLLKKKITAQVSRSISNGTSFAECAKQLANYTRIGYNNAIRIARTEGHRIQAAATMDTMYNAKERGADVVKQWDATLDGLTREGHVAVDGEIRELDEPFSNGLDYPGDPSGGAAEVVNCRCAVLQRARWAVGDGFTKWNNFTGELETFDSPESYAEFKKGFWSKENKDYMDYVQRMEKQYGTKDFRKVLDRMTDKEYQKYFGLLKNNPLFNTAAPVIDVETVMNLGDMLAGCKTSAEVSNVAKNYFRQKTGCKIQNIDFDHVDFDAAREMALKLDDLDSRFNSALTSVQARYMDPHIGGECKPNQMAFMKYMNSGNMGDLESEIFLNETYLKNRKVIEKDFDACHRGKYGSLLAQNTQADEQFMNVATLVHEYGHSILPGKAMELYVNTGGENRTFTTIRRMYRQHMIDLRDLNREITRIRDSFAGLPDGLQKGIEAAKSLQDQYDKMCVSHYSKESVGEFIAECFCDAELSSEPRDISTKVYNLLVKAFGKGG